MIIISYKKQFLSHIIHRLYEVIVVFTQLQKNLPILATSQTSIISFRFPPDAGPSVTSDLDLET